MDTRAAGRDPIHAITDRIGWDQLERSVRDAEELTRSADDGLDEVVERYPRIPQVRAYLPDPPSSFRAARSSRRSAARRGRGVEAYVSGRPVRVLPKRVPDAPSLKPRWRKVVFPAGGGIDRRAYEIAVIVYLRERLASGSVWVDGSRAYRTLDDYLLPQAAFVGMRAGRPTWAGGRCPCSSDWHDERGALLTRRMGEVERAAAAGELVDVARSRATAS